MTRTKENLEKPEKPKPKTKFENLSSALKENLQRRKKIRRHCEDTLLQASRKVP